MTSLAGEFETDLTVPDLMVACTDALDGLGWEIESVDRNKIVSRGDGEEPPMIEVVLDELSDGTGVRIIGSATDPGPLAHQALVGSLDQVRDAIKAAVELESAEAQVEPDPVAPDPDGRSEVGEPPEIVSPETASETPMAPAAPRQDEGRIPLFGARGKARELAEEVASLRDQLAQTGALSLMDIEQRHAELQQRISAETEAFERQQAEANARLGELREEIVVTEETAVLQEVGVYEYRHPLSDAVAYQAELKRLKDRIKTMARKDGGAILAATDWTVNNSLSEGRKMVRDFSKLMLRAYNAEADNLVRGLKPYKLETAIDRLTKVATMIVKLGRTMGIQISDAYHLLRVRELELTADYLEKLAEEKEREREEKARLREERQAQLEMERERARLEKERQQYEIAMAGLEEKGDKEGIERLRDELGKIDRAIADVDYRVANVKAGFVYVISNVGSLGEKIIKIGMTRRVDPNVRVRELGDASVPFKYDVHALFFSKNAAGIEAELHRRLSERRVNRVNLRREFFYATPAEVKEHLLEVAGELIKYEEAPEAVEYHQSLNEAREETGSAQQDGDHSAETPT